MRCTTLVAVLGCLTVAACGSVQEPEPPQTPAPDAQPAPPPSNATFLPANTHLTVHLNDSLSTRTSRVGDTFTVEVAEAIVATNGATVIPAGSVITGMVTGVDDSDHAGDQAAIRLNFLRINLNGVTHPMSAHVVSTGLVTESERGEDVAEAAAAGALAGAVLGAVIGGDLRDVLIGATLGAGAGTIISLGTGDVEAVLPAGTRMTIRTVDRLDLR